MFVSSLARAEDPRFIATRVAFIMFAVDVDVSADLRRLTGNDRPVVRPFFTTEDTEDHGECTEIAIFSA
jgi:hypothetical protein